MVRTCRWFTPSILIATIASLAAVSDGRPVAVASDADATEAIARVTAWIKAHSKEAAAGYRVLARIHALAWAYGDKIPLVGTSGKDALPIFTEDSTVLVSRTAPREGLWMSKTIPAGERPERPITAEDAKHLSASIAAYQKALELSSTDGLSELGLAWMIAQQGLYARTLPADYFGERKATDADKAAWAQSIQHLTDEKQAVRDAASKALLAAMPKCLFVLRDVNAKDLEATSKVDAVLQGWFELQALEHYRKAYVLEADVDLMGAAEFGADSQVSAKAGTQILAILERHPEAATKDEVKTIRETLEPLAEKQRKLMMIPQ